MRTGRVCLALVSSAALIAACGTTVPLTQSGTAAAGGNQSLGQGQGLGSPLGSGLPTTGATSGPFGPGTTVGTAAPGTTVGAPGYQPAPGQVGTSTASGGVSGPGVTARQVYIGFIYDKNAGAVNKAAGIGSITSGDTKAEQNAVVNDINKHGGVAGRQLVPVFANFDSESSQTLDQQYAAICQQFTHDQPRVFAVDGVGVESYRKCIAKAGVSMLSDSLPSLGQAEFNRYPGMIELGYPNLDRLAAYYVKPLVEQHYFSPWNTVTGTAAPSGVVKVGILTYNDIIFSHAVDTYLVPSLKRLGYTPIVEKVAQVTTASDYGAQGAAVSSAQLTFAQNGVTHVIPFESNGGLSELYLAAARPQNYYPRLGISSASGTQALFDAGVADKKQIQGATGFGWIPGLDVHANYNPDNGPYSNANRRYCLNVMKANGIVFDSSNAQGIALGICAELYLFKTALDKTPQQIVMGTFLRQVDTLGTSYQAAGSLGEQFGPGRHDPANLAYHWRWYDDCGCLHYEGKLQTIP